MHMQPTLTIIKFNKCGNTCISTKMCSYHTDIIKSVVRECELSSCTAIEVQLTGLWSHRDVVRIEGALWM